MNSKRKSLTFRIILFSGAWIMLALLGTAVVLLSFYRNHIASHYDAHVQMHMEEMAAAARLNEAGELDLAYPPSDPRYRIDHSGWYWQIVHDGKVLARSPSLAGKDIDLGRIGGLEHAGAMVLDGPYGTPLRVQTRQISAGNPGEHLLLISSAPMMGVTDDVSDVAQHLVVSFAVLALGLVVAVYLQVRIALKPISAIHEGISDIHRGKSDKLHGDFPSGVQSLVDELNNLLEHNSVLLRRARNQLGDLAHSIKNPLTVINNEARSMDDSETGRLITKQTTDISESVNHHLSRARAFGTTKVLGSRAKVRPVAEDLAFALRRIYQKRDLEFDLEGLGDSSVRCEVQDLEEMLGNLMDNACKWAKSRVIVHCTAAQDRRYLFVEDDGPGIPEDKIDHVLQRGQRLDESKQGHGLGLSIVQELVELYRGAISLNRSDHGGLSVKLELPGG